MITTRQSPLDDLFLLKIKMKCITHLPDTNLFPVNRENYNGRKKQLKGKKPYIKPQLRLYVMSFFRWESPPTNKPAVNNLSSVFPAPQNLDDRQQQ